IALACHNHESTYSSLPPGLPRFLMTLQANAPYDTTNPNPVPGSGTPATGTEPPLWYVAGNQSPPPGSAQLRCYGPNSVVHILAEMEQTTMAQLLVTNLAGGTSNSDFNEANPQDNLDGTPFRRPDIQFQITMQRFIRCPSSEQSEVEYNDLSLENLRKGNYA